MSHSGGKQTVQCPNCHTQLMAPARLAGRQVSCPSCATTLTIPGMSVQAPPPAPAPPAREPEPEEYPPPRRRSRAVRTDDDEYDYEDSPRLPGPRKGFRCPFCGSDSAPRVRKQISQTGWVVFVLLLLFCFPLCFIGLLIKEDYRQCYECGMKLG